MGLNIGMFKFKWDHYDKTQTRPISKQPAIYDDVRSDEFTSN